MHLTPAQRCGAWSTPRSRLTSPAAAGRGRRRPTDAEVFEVPALGSAWQPALRGLDTRLGPGVLRPITFDDRAAAGRTDLVYVHLGHALVQKAAADPAQRAVQRRLPGAAASPRSSSTTCRSPASPRCPGWSWSAAAGSGCTRRCSSPASGCAAGRWPRRRSRRLLERRPRRPPTCGLADRRVRTALAEAWNAPDARLRSRLLAAMTRRAEEHQHQVTDALLDRQKPTPHGPGRSSPRSAATCANRWPRSARPRPQQETMLFADDQQRQRRRDIRAMEDGSTSLDDEERARDRRDRGALRRHQSHT